jgi:hypothetical protein
MYALRPLSPPMRCELPKVVRHLHANRLAGFTDGASLRKMERMCDVARVATLETSPELNCVRPLHACSADRNFNWSEVSRGGGWSAELALDFEPAALPGIDTALEVDRLTTLGVEKLGYAGRTSTYCADTDNPIVNLV